MHNTDKGLSIKEVRSQKSLSSADILRTKGERFFRWVCDIIFFKLWCVRADMARVQRWAESEKLISKLDPAPKTKTPNPVSLQILHSKSAPISAMLLHAFNMHYSIHTESGFGFFPKIQIWIRKMWPDPFRFRAHL